MAEFAGEYVSTKQAAERAGMSRSPVQYLISKGAIAAQRVGFVWLVNVSSLEHYMANRPWHGVKSGQKINRPRKLALA
jgi:excisionase family DNA binding protein